MDNGNYFERLSQESERREDGNNGILESASAFAHRVLEEIEALAGTTACKTVQLVRLKKWAQEQDCWFSDRSQFAQILEIDNLFTYETKRFGIPALFGAAHGLCERW